MLAIDTRNSQAHFRKVCAELVKQITHSVLFPDFINASPKLLFVVS